MLGMAALPNGFRPAGRRGVQMLKGSRMVREGRDGKGNGASGRHMRLKGNPRKLGDPFLSGFLSLM